MKSSTKTYVLDANAVLDYVQDGPGAGTVERLFREAFRSDAALIISTLNIGEVFYSIWKIGGEQKAREIIDDLTVFPWQIVAANLPQSLKAGELKARHRVPFVDCIVAALALEYQATTVTSDRDFEKFGRQFPVLWLPRM